MGDVLAYTERLGTLHNPCMLGLHMEVAPDPSTPGRYVWRLVERADPSCYTYDVIHGKGSAPSLLAAQHQARSLGTRLVVEKWRWKREWASDYALKQALGGTCRCGHGEDDHRSWTGPCKVSHGALMPQQRCACKAWRPGIGQARRG